MSETRRVGHGYLLDGKSVISVTAVLKEGWAKPALTRWAARTAARYAVDHWEWLVEAVGSGQLSMDGVFDLISGAPWAELQRAALRGTQIHALARSLTHDEEIEIPDEAAGLVGAALRFLDEWQPLEERTEVSVFSRRYKYAGTFDLLCTIAGLGTCLLDYKSNLKGPYGETGLQLAAYGHADFMLVDGTEVPLPKIDFYGSVWLRDDGHYELYPFAVTEDTFRLFRYLQWVVSQRPHIEREIKGAALVPPTLVAEATR